MKVLVTGASGFVGGYVLRALAREGADAVAMARDDRAREVLGKAGFEAVRGDVTDPGSLDDAFRGVEAVIHLAAKVSVFASDRGELERINVGGTRNLLEACRRHGIRRLVHASSVVAVGASSRPDQVLNESSENGLRRFNLPNCESKCRSEERVLQAAERGELEAVVLNPSMVFGAGDALKAPRRGSLLAANGRLRYYPSGGVSVVGVQDVARACVAALRCGRSGERYILSGENWLLKDVLAQYAKLADVPAPRKPIPAWILRGVGRTVDTFGIRAPLGREGALTSTLYHWFNCDKAREELGFAPSFAADAIRESFEWMKERGLLDVR